VSHSRSKSRDRNRERNRDLDRVKDRRESHEKSGDKPVVPPIRKRYSRPPRKDDSGYKDSLTQAAKLEATTGGDKKYDDMMWDGFQWIPATKQDAQQYRQQKYPPHLANQLKAVAGSASHPQQQMLLNFAASNHGALNPTLTNHPSLMGGSFAATGMTAPTPRDETAAAHAANFAASAVQQQLSKFLPHMAASQTKPATT